jgi:hypothetical protein
MSRTNIENQINQSSALQQPYTEAGTGIKRRKKPKRIAEMADTKPGKKKEKANGDGE